MNRLRYTLFVVTGFLVLALSAMSAVPAFADDSTPPPTETPTVVTPPVGEVTEVAPAMEESAPTEVASPVNEPALTQVPAVEAPVPSEETVAELLASVPEGTELIVTNGDGQALQLVTEEAAQAIFEGDPLWCPVGVTPIAGMGGCSPSFTSFTDDLNPDGGLLAWLATATPAQVGKAGVIWVAALYNSSTETGPISLNIGNMVNFALTINGGWTGGTLLNPNTPSTFNVPLSIDWNAAVTLNNILVEGANAPGGSALEVYTGSNITLNNVDVQNNTTANSGAILDNMSGAGNVVVNDSTFNGNPGDDGLIIYSNGTITAKNLSASDNGGNGVYLDNSNAPTAKAVTLTGSNQFISNGFDGLVIYSEGAITLSNVTALYNTGGSGAYLDNWSGSSAVMLKGTNNFSNNGWDGLRVYSQGAITINSITANDNGTDLNRDPATWMGNGDDGIFGTPDDWYDYDAYGKGAYLSNWSSAPKPITLTGTNTFNGNASNGLYLDANGLVKINNLTANYNECDPLKDLDDYGCAGAFINGGGVTVTGFGTFIGNAEQGLEVYDSWVPSLGTSVGAISLTNLYATDNGAGGVWAVNGGTLPYNVTITGTNVFNDNQNGDGLFVWSEGMVALSNVTATGNAYTGVLVENTSALTPKAVTITGTNIFNDNSTGLAVYSYGAITTNNVTAMFNGYGVKLDNCDDDGSSCLVYSPQPVTMNGTNNISENSYGQGLYIQSRGAIKVNNLTANYNYNSDGAVLDNNWVGAVGTVSVTGYGIFLGNGGTGLAIYSAGAVTLANLTANDNAWRGAEIFNRFNSLLPANVTITGTNNFSGNGNDGLRIRSYGMVTLNNITANWNGDDSVPQTGNGVWIDNYNTGTLSRPVLLNGINFFTGNFGDGLHIESLGAITVSKVNASLNDGSGAHLDNQWNLFTAPVTILGYGVFNDNFNGDGLTIYSNGSIITSNITANRNGTNGVAVDNQSRTTTPVLTATSVNVTMLGANTFNGNYGGDGLLITSDGIITLNNITANDNAGRGASLDNVTYGSVLKNILLNGVNTFINNDGTGLFFNASGNVSLTRVISNLNNDGVVDGNFSAGIAGTAGGTITLTCGSLNFNEGSGYNLTAAGTITLKGVFNYGNGATDSSSPTAVITRTCPLP